jgi:two-component system response regulator MprA
LPGDVKAVLRHTRAGGPAGWSADCNTNAVSGSVGSRERSKQPQAEEKKMSCDVLIIEDEEAIAMAVRVVLSNRGFCTFEAHSGEEGLEMVHAEHPALVLLDVRLPGMDGWEVCRRIKAETRDNAPLVVFLTAATQAHDREKARKVGGDYFMPKPFEISELTKVVRNLLEEQVASTT